MPCEFVDFLEPGVRRDPFLFQPACLIGLVEGLLDVIITDMETQIQQSIVLFYKLFAKGCRAEEALRPPFALSLHRLHKKPTDLQFSCEINHFLVLSTHLVSKLRYGQRVFFAEFEGSRHKFELQHARRLVGSTSGMGID